MPLPNTTRANIWKVTLEIEDAADLAGYSADPELNPWPLIADPEAIYYALRYAIGEIRLPNGGRASIVKMAVDPPEDDELLTERRFKVEQRAAREVTEPRAEIPATAAEAYAFLESVEAYLASLWVDDWDAYHAAMQCVWDASADLDDAGELGLSNEEREDCSRVAELKWEMRKAARPRQPVG